jgi:hypothetical protein
VSGSTASSAERAALLVVAALVVAAHVAWFFAFRWESTPDTKEYAAAARSLRDGRGFLDARGAPETGRTPGYPLLVAALALRPNAIAIVQHALIVAVALMTAWFLRGRPRAAIAALALIGFDPALFAAATLLMTEALFVFVMQAGALALLAAMRRGSPAIAAAAGVLIGFAPLVRPIAIVVALPLIAIAAIASRARTAAVTLAFALPALLLPSLWVLRNERATGVATLSTVAGANMLYWRAAGTLAMNELPGFVAGRDETAYHVRFFSIQRTIRGNAVGIIAAHPAAFVRCAINGDLHMLFDPEPHLPMHAGFPERDVLFVVLVAMRIAMVAAAVAGIVALWRIDRAAAMLCGAMIVYFLVLSAGPEANFLSTRFRAPIVPFESMAAAFAVRWLR